MRYLILFAVALGAPGFTLADDAALRNCRLLQDSAARLACYDAISLLAPVGPVSSGADAAGAAAGLPSKGPAGSAGSPAPMGPERPGAAIAATQAATAVEPTAIFGFENRPNPAAPAVDALVSSIPGRFEGWQANGRLQLANGQVWQVSDGSQAYYDLNDPAVRITRGVAGTFFMQIAGVAQSPRVRRIQ